MRTAAVPILTWHSMHVDGPGYAENDHSAFRDDLEWLHGAGFKVVSLATIAAALREGRLDRLAGCVGLSMDDGSDFDYYDLPHPTWGPQRGMAGILADFRARHGADAQPDLHATLFTIVSPHARAELDRTCMIGCRWWNDDWYRAAEASSLLAIESHSWDHNHFTLASTATRAERGTFEVADPAEVQVELVQAARHLRELRGRGGDVLFAYPYGNAARYLVEEWLPAHGDANGIVAAFAASNTEPVTAASSRWRIPRYVFGDQWRTRDDLAVLLRDAGIAPAARQVRPSSPIPPAPGHWRDRLRTYEINDAGVVAGDLFRRCFGHDPPDYPRHFVLVHSPEPGSGEAPDVVAYVHQTRMDNYALCGGMCVDERAYRRFPPWLFKAVREQGGLATIVTRDSVEMLGEECVAVFGHVGEPRARAADLRTGFVDTDREHLMVIWRKDLPEQEKGRLVDRVGGLGPF
jgi:peptidoglycan/xylan/chitin deacetylase (PgdA/CDA1 family)